MKLYVITGRSGSGKSTVLHALEDEGFTCIDNFPVALLSKLVEDTLNENPDRNVAISVDARSPESDLKDLPEAMRAASRIDLQPRLVYLDAAGPVLVKRFDETRRRHPLERVDLDLRQCINIESHLIAHLAEMADLKIDTTQLTVHELVTTIKERLVEIKNRELSLVFRSFAYRNGVPVDADFVFDVRCLPNPHWDPNLRAFSGLDEPVRKFFGDDESVDKLYHHIYQFLTNWLPIFEEQNRAYMTVAMGCTGGRHRSVYMADRIAEAFRSDYPHVLIRHREHGGDPNDPR